MCRNEATRTELLNAIGPDRSDEERSPVVESVEHLLQKMAAAGNRRCDPVRSIQSYLGDRWSSLIMHLLSSGDLRFNELRRLIVIVAAEHEISPRQLTLKLRVLERDGLLARHISSGSPSRIEYKLTHLGRGAYAHFNALVQWAEQANGAIRSARMAYDMNHQDAAQLQKQEEECES